MKILNYVLLFTLFYGCVAGDVGGKKDAKGSSAAIAPITPKIITPIPTLTLPLNVPATLVDLPITFSASTTNPDSIYFESVWYRDLDMDGLFISAGETSAPSINTVISPPSIDPSIIGVGNATVYLEITDGAGTVYDSKSWNLAVGSPSFNPFAITSNATAYASIHARSGVDYFNNGFTFNGNTDSRGSIMNLTGYDNNEDFCLRRATNGPGVASDYRVVFLDSTDSAISTALPIGIQFSGAFNDACLFGNYSTAVLFIGAARAEKIKAVVYNISYASNPEVDRYEWDVLVEDFNTPPVITHATGVVITPQVSASATVIQDSSFTFSFTVVDKDQDSSLDPDFNVSYTLNLAPVDAASLFPSTATPTPDCVRPTTPIEVANAVKYDCTINFPSFGTSGNINSSTTYTIQSQVIDSTGLSSNVLTWTITPSEVNTPPTITVASHTSAGGATTDVTATELTSTYAFIDGATTTAVTTAVETTSTLRLRAYISDAERDDYDVNFYYQELTAPSSYKLIEAISVSKITDQLSDQVQSVAFTLPEEVIAGAGATGTINLRIEVIGQSDSGADPAVIEDIDILVSQYNPNPAYAGGQSPADAGYTVVEGKPITLQITGAPTDASDGTDAGLTIAYQWEMDDDCGLGNPYLPIAGATSSSLKWTPEVSAAGLSDGQTVCFRLCIGDGGHGNTPDCTSVSALPAAQVATTGANWATGITVRQSDQVNVATSSSDIYSLMTPGAVPNTDDLITVTHNGSEFTVTKRTYTQATGVTSAASTLTTLGTDPGGVNEAPTDISINTDGTKLFIAYRILESDNFVTPTSVVRVMVVDISGAPTYNTTFQKNIVSDSLGKITVNGLYWYLPFIDFNNSDNISVIRKPLIHVSNGINPIIGGEITTPLNVTTYTEVTSAYDAANSSIILALKTAAGIYDLRSISISDGAAPGDTSNFSNDIFNTNIVTSFTFSGPNGTNPFVYASGIYGTKFINFYEASTLIGAGTLDTTISTGITKLLSNVNAIQTTASSVSGELIVATKYFDNNAYLFKVDALGATVTESSKVLNDVASSVSSAGTNELSLTLMDNYDVGDFGAVVGESIKDTVIFHYHDGTDSRASFINIETETGTDGAIPFFQ